MPKPKAPRVSPGSGIMARVWTAVLVCMKNPSLEIVMEWSPKPDDEPTYNIK